MANSDSTTDYKCKLCFLEFDTIHGILRHELTHVVSDGNQTGTKRRQSGGRGHFRKKHRKSVQRLQPEVDEKLAEVEDDVREILTSCGPGAELHALCRIFQPNPNYLSELYNAIIGDLQFALRTDFEAGNWNIQAFGSTITGMAFKDSDIDLFISPEHRATPFKKHFNRVNNILQRSKTFKDVVPIRGARVPIIKCCHVPSGVNMDVNMSSCFGVYTSKFISKLFSYDQRIHPFMLVVKIWAKSWGITKTTRMTNYCLVLLVIFYLQNCPNPILPPLKDFRSGVPILKVEGVNFAYNENLVSQTKNQCNIRDLMKGFFEFYSQFDFAANIVCPLLGKPINRIEFSSGKFNFPEYVTLINQMQKREAQLQQQGMLDWYRDVRTTPLDCTTLVVVQDPFVLNGNTARIVGVQLLDLIKRQVTYAYKICQEPNNSPAHLLLRLFYEAPPTIEAPMAPSITPSRSTTSINIQNNSPAASLKPKQGVTFTCRLTPVETELFFVRLQLRKANPTKTYEKADIDRAWSVNMMKFIREILTDLYKMTVTPQAKFGKNDKFNFNGELETYTDTWQLRKCDTKKGYAIFLQEQATFAALAVEQRATKERLIHSRLSVEVEANFSAVKITMQPIELLQKSPLGVFFKDLTSRVRPFLKAYFEKLAMETNTLIEN